MRFPRVLTVVTLPLGGVPAALAAQGPVKVEVSIPASHTVWYTDPLWLGIGAVAVLIVIVLAIMASRSGERKSTTTVIR
jgi:hypothetical protein